MNIAEPFKSQQSANKAILLSGGEYRQEGRFYVATVDPLVGSKLGLTAGIYVGVEAPASQGGGVKILDASDEAMKAKNNDK